MRHLRKGYGYKVLSIPLFFLFISLNLILTTPAIAKEDAYLDSLLKETEIRKLYSDRYWDVLLHYKNSISGKQSLVDSPVFFLSSDGKNNPKAEIEATIRALFMEDEMNDQHPRCRFVARYAWLKEVLNIDETRLPDVTCKEYNDAISRINPKKAVFIFPVGYMNSPASMFGHTLLRIDSSYQSKLISYAANYAAWANDKNGFIYAFKGLFGYYLGYFTILPYYEKVMEYNELEQRDIWEYELNLSEAEVRRMVMHLWELRDIYSYYYFFDENCSYNLLFLLEAARPSLNLTGRFHGWVVPIDTIRVVLDSGIAGAAEYRPAKATRIRYIASLMDEETQELTLKIVRKEIKPEELQRVSPEDKIKILDLSAEITQYDYGKKRMTKDDYQKQFLSILTERSRLGTTGDTAYNIPVPASPEKGHKTSLLRLGAGIKKNNLFYEAGYRTAYHALSDFDDGYIEGSQIVFLNTNARYYTKDNKVRLTDFDIIDIVSLSPGSIFFRSPSWKVKTGFTRKTISGDKEILIYQLNPGAGFAFENSVTGLTYCMFETNLNVSGSLKDSYAFGPGVSVGSLRLITDYWKINVSLKAMSFLFGEKHDIYEGRVVQSFKIDRNNTLKLDFGLGRVQNVHQDEMTLNWNHYF
ncbi:MAG: DUF4105 domain-containing protein [Nitrospirae bacterium]|nr:DUF4105 domain-containing protein [Nitrospirota bacterium]